MEEVIPVFINKGLTPPVRGIDVGLDFDHNGTIDGKRLIVNLVLFVRKRCN